MSTPVDGYWTDRFKKQLYAETYGMGDIKVGLITGEYPNPPAAPWPNEDPRYPPEHPLSRESNERARRSGQQVPKRKSP